MLEGLNSAGNAIMALRARVKKGNPDLETDTGQLFLLREEGVAGLVYKPPLKASEFLKKLWRVPPEKRVSAMDIIPTTDPVVPFVVSPIELKDGKTFLSGREVILLP